MAYTDDEVLVRQRGLQSFLHVLKAEGSLLGGSWDSVSKVISTLIGVISIVTLIIALVAKSHDPLSRACEGFEGIEGWGFRFCGW